MKSSHFLLIGVLILSACTVGPDYEAPDINAPPQFVSQDVLKALNEGKDEQSLAADWWTGFNDDVLNALVETGLENNFEIAAAAARVKEAQARIKLAGAGDNLTADVDVDSDIQERRELNPDREATTTRSTGASLGVALPLDVFGRTRREVEAARAGLEAAQAELRSIVLRISSDIVSEYLRLRGNQRQLELLRESVELQEKTLSIVKSRYESGLSPELDLRRAETSVENLRADISPLEEELLNSRNRLASLSGQYPGVYEKTLKEQKETPVYNSSIPQLIPLEVLSTRPDVRQAEADLKQAIANIGAAEADYYPAFELSGSISIGTTGVSSMPVTNVLIASLGVLIEQVLADGGARDANFEIAHAQAEEELASYEQVLREAIEEVEMSLAAIQSSQRRQVSLEKAVTSSQRSFSQAETLYQQGLISFLDVVDAQRVLANAEQALARERTNYAKQIAILFRVLGVNVEKELGKARHEY
ncbi:MAG: efflux transporter outer membrane subunit [Alphaproteobacteria bacterium]|nr:efflux transporter outer membrane subunit [Alphaproteobacteria bacterium]